VSAAVVAWATVSIMLSTKKNSQTSSQIHELSARIYDLTYRPYLKTEISKPYLVGEQQPYITDVIFRNNGQVPIEIRKIEYEASQDGLELTGQKDAEFMLIQHERNTMPVALPFVNFGGTVALLTVKVVIMYKGVAEKYHVRHTWYEYNADTKEFNKTREWEPIEDTATDEKEHGRKNKIRRINPVVSRFLRRKAKLPDKVPKDESAEIPTAQKTERQEQPKE